MDWDTIKSIITVYGPLALGWPLLIMLWRVREADRVKFDLERKLWTEERKAYDERYATKAESWMEKHAAQAKAVTSVLESALKKRKPSQEKQNGDE